MHDLLASGAEALTIPNAGHREGRLALTNLALAHSEKPQGRTAAGEGPAGAANAGAGSSGCRLHRTHATWLVYAGEDRNLMRGVRFLAAEVSIAGTTEASATCGTGRRFEEWSGQSQSDDGR